MGKVCECCAHLLVQREKESVYNFIKRRFCSKQCARRAQVQIRASRGIEKARIEARRDKILKVLAESDKTWKDQDIAVELNENLFTIKDDIYDLVYWGYVSIRNGAVKFAWWPWQKTRLINLLGGFKQGVTYVLEQDDI